MIPLSLYNFECQRIESIRQSCSFLKTPVCHYVRPEEKSPQRVKHHKCPSFFNYDENMWHVKCLRVTVSMVQGI